MSNEGRQTGGARFLRFFGVSTVGTAADYVSAVILHAFGLPGVAASTLGFLLGSAINYLGHHHVTFRTPEGGPASLTGFLKYLAAVITSLGVRLVVLVGLAWVAALPFWFVLAVAFAASFICSYLISLFWVFRRKA